MQCVAGTRYFAVAVQLREYSKLKVDRSIIVWCPRCRRTFTYWMYATGGCFRFRYISLNALIAQDVAIRIEQ